MKKPKFHLECVDLNLETSTDYFGRFVCKPLEMGQSITIGNVLRRVLLTELPGVSILGARIENIDHEFETVDGVREDVLEILLNIKEIILKSHNPTQAESFGRLKVQGPAIITASCFDLDPSIEVVNPNQYIATLTDDCVLEMEIKIGWGKGYILEENESIVEPLDYLRMEPRFTPVRRVAYQVAKLSDAFSTQEHLILDVWTNGSITPLDAVSLASKIIIEWFQAIENLEVNTSKKEDMVKPIDLSIIPIEELNLSKRAFNSLKSAQFNFVGQLTTSSKTKLSKLKNFGKKSMDEVSHAVEERYGIRIE